MEHNTQQENVNLKDELYGLFAMRNYQALADLEEILKSTDKNKMSDQKKKALIGHIETISEVSLEAYAVILRKVVDM